MPSTVAPNALLHAVAGFMRDRRGTIAVTFALMLLPIMMFTGFAVDYGRIITVRMRTQNKIDAAALAGARATQSATSSSATTVAQTTAQAFFNATPVPFALSTAVSAVATDGKQTTFTWTATSWIRTPFLSTAALVYNKAAASDAPAACSGSWWACQKVNVSASASLSNSGRNTGYSIETAFMLDITGSMAGQKIADLKAAASSAIDILVWDDQSTMTSRVAIVPFALDVRLPNAAAYQAATGRSPATATKSVYGYTFGTRATEYCVVERTGNNKYTDAKPASNSFSMAEWMYTGYGTYCDVTIAAPVQPLTSNTSTLHAIIDGLQASGGTAGHIGTAWAWYVLSPNWNALWSSANAAGAYDVAYNINTKVGTAANMKLRKIAVLMTDGDYNTQYSSAGVDTGYFGDNPANDTSNNQAAQLCAGMKASGIEVYTVGFSEGGGLSTAAKSLLGNCATDSSHFYDATSGDSLMNAFRDIALKIASLRLSG